MPRAMFWNFVDTKGSFDIKDLISFLKNRIKGAAHLETALGGGKREFKKEYDKPKWNKSKQLDKPFYKPLSKKGTNLVESSNSSDSDSDMNDNKVIENYSLSCSRSKKVKRTFCDINLTELLDASESESEEEIIIQGKINNQEVSMLWDPGAARNLLPASMFPEVLMNKRFKSASGHHIKAHGPVKVDLKLDGETVPIKAYINECNLAILGRKFTGRTKAYTDGQSTKRIKLWHGDKWLDIYRKNNNQLKKKSNKKALSAQDIHAIFACAHESDLDEEDEDHASSLKSSDSPRVKALLKKWQHLGIGIGDTDQVQHHLYIKDNTKPVNVRGKRRLPVKLIEEVKKAIEEMLRLGVIEESQSEWCSAIVPVTKKDGSIRVAIDYRLVNEVCQKDAYPMPRIDVIIERLCNSTVFSKLDLTKGYYQVRIHPEHRKYTAFSFGKKLYQFTRMPFGLASAPQTFQRLMNQVLANLPFAECYLDDIVVFSKSESEHLQHLDQVFKALEKANLRFNPEKCQFAVEEIEYLGFKISHNQRCPTASKVEKILHFPEPTTKKELDSFIGLAGQYRSLIEDFSAKADPLYELRKVSKKTERLKWKAEHKAAFENLKMELTRPPVVMLPDCTKPFIVRTDASGTGMGAVLLQVVDGQRRIIEYASKQFKGAQLRYPTIEKEATAIDYALKKWRHLLIGTEFTLETDHRPLQFLNSMKDTHGKLARMALRVQQFQPFTIVHIPGKENIEADVLSRMIATITLDYSESDDISRRKAKNPSEFAIDTLGRFRFIGDGKDRLAIPRKHRVEIMKALHDEFGHLSVDRVLNLARARFFWPKMNDDIKKYIKACHNCAMMKDSIIPKAEMKPTTTEVFESFARWHVDAIGPITTPSTTGNRYILVAQDAFSKWPEALPVQECTTEVIKRWISDALINRYGLPNEIMTDHGSQFDSAEFKRFTEEMGFTHLFSTSYHHQTNGVVERFNKTLENLIRTTAEQSNQWDEVVEQCLMAYRTTVHKTTKRSPFEVVFGKQPRILIDGQLALDTPEAEQDRQMIQREVTEAIQENAAASKRRYDQNCRARMRDLHGKKVYWKNAQPNPTEGKHLAPRFKGPFLAERTESRWNYRITDRDGNSKIIHLDQLKECANNDIPLAPGLRGRGRPRRVHTVVYYRTRPTEGEV